MPHTRWKPNVTVAALIEEAGRFLLVEEETSEGLRLNNPAGHLDPAESLQQAVVREALEETARVFTPQHVLGIYMSRFQRPSREQDVTYMRVAFVGCVGDELPGHRYDSGIVRTLWLTADEIRANAARLRSPLVLQCVEDHLAGRCYPLELLTAHASLYQPELKA